MIILMSMLSAIGSCVIILFNFFTTWYMYPLMFMLLSAIGNA